MNPAPIAMTANSMTITCCNGGFPYANIKVWPINGSSFNVIRNRAERNNTTNNVCKTYAMTLRDPKLLGHWIAENGTMACKCPRDFLPPECRLHRAALDGAGAAHSFRIFLFLAIIPLTFGLLAAVGGFLCKLCCCCDCFECHWRDWRAEYKRRKEERRLQRQRSWRRRRSNEEPLPPSASLEDSTITYCSSGDSERSPASALMSSSASASSTFGNKLRFLRWWCTTCEKGPGSIDEEDGFEIRTYDSTRQRVVYPTIRGSNVEAAVEQRRLIADMVTIGAAIDAGKHNETQSSWRSTTTSSFLCSLTPHYGNRTCPFVHRNFPQGGTIAPPPPYRQPRVTPMANVKLESVPQPLIYIDDDDDENVNCAAAAGVDGDADSEEMFPCDATTQTSLYLLRQAAEELLAEETTSPELALHGDEGEVSKPCSTQSVLP